MKKFAISLGLVVVALGATATAAVYTGYADEFVVHYLDCNTVGSTTSCHDSPADWFQGDYAQWPAWETIGQQGANPAGRANAREKLMFRFRDVSTTKCESVTVTITRYQVTNPPPVTNVYPFNSCNTATGLVVGSVSYNYSSCPTVGDSRIQARMLPVYDFSADTSLPGQTVGYRSLLSVLTSTGQVFTGISCYTIRWF